MPVLRQLLFLGIAAGLTWWFLLRTPPDEELESAPAGPAPPIAVRPNVQEASARPADEPAVQELEASAPTPAPPPPERGDPRGSEEPEALAASESEPREEPAPPEPARASVSELANDARLVEEARRDLEGELRRGFQTVLLAAPEDQLELARAFGEELVLVPRETLDPEHPNPTYYRLRTSGTPRVERVEERPRLEAYRQYRDLFDYEYSRLPEPLRELRRSVLSRDDVYLFAALIPLREWAVVVGRRQEALAQVDREADDVRRFVLRYARDRTGAFDLFVEEIEYADGSRERLASLPSDRSTP